jgi:hypothetical protein
MIDVLWAYLDVQVSQITLEYTGCENAGPTATTLPKYSYKMRSSDSSAVVSPLPKWQTKTTTESSTSSGTQCVLEFHLPADLQPPVFMYYRLTSFYQNHRRYVKSMDSDQLKGKAVSADTLNGGDCKPLAIYNDKIVYPCGLIANSMFNGMIHRSYYLAIDSSDRRTRHILQRLVAQPSINLRVQLQEYRLARRGPQVFH